MFLSRTTFQIIQKVFLSCVGFYRMEKGISLYSSCILYTYFYIILQGYHVTLSKIVPEKLWPVTLTQFDSSFFLSKLSREIGRKQYLVVFISLNPVGTEMEESPLERQQWSCWNNTFGTLAFCTTLWRRTELPAAGAKYFCYYCSWAQVPRSPVWQLIGLMKV